ncbi:heavy-metal-associated domain-containing protein [Companilactobacillus mishanensis]|uniref:Heavy-metal-associated domain-containing protein n=1 Tax=Companilactobacillus mishanensis TaxID=2486008 RepID=A0A5P0ZKV2_9LACO|nr:heavy metal-associated domain-containing protein [Companilactobacillus mishanensis]MQS45905.1 heavy-metal-associated domain-containing protein [Companilactobacillus mishanensis]MQS53605.1 heavy-metal-associated domain-containing protein [Companilactobacillus mishanensis]MQS89971.1 heavy-metal-associated domain-containing protein [Companilactobacillus mishanensis]
MAKKILISGLKCENCPRHIAERLSDVDGVDKIEKDMTKMTATVLGNADVEEVRDALADKPFTVEEIAD